MFNENETIHTDDSDNPSNNVGCSRDPYYTHEKRNRIAES